MYRNLYMQKFLRTHTLIVWSSFLCHEYQSGMLLLVQQFTYHFLVSVAEKVDKWKEQSRRSGITELSKGMTEWTHTSPKMDTHIPKFLRQWTPEFIVHFLGDTLQESALQYILPVSVFIYKLESWLCESAELGLFSGWSSLTF